MKKCEKNVNKYQNEPKLYFSFVFRNKTDFSSNFMQEFSSSLLIKGLILTHEMMVSCCIFLKICGVLQ